MTLAVQLKEPTWWIWLVTVGMLVAAVLGHAPGLAAAIFLSAVQTIFFGVRHRGLGPYAVQIRLGYTLLLVLCLLPALRLLVWVPTLGTVALLVYGYCLMARMLSLMPWNRREPWSCDLLRRTFFTRPAVAIRSAAPGLSGCPGGVCELEAEVATLNVRPSAPRIAASGAVQIQ